MSSLRFVGRSAAAHEKDRASLCRFTFADGRRCRTPRSGGDPNFCRFHARKEAQARTAEKLGKDLSYFFSGDYLSACDLATALGRILAAVAQGHIKPRAARTLACLAQTLLQTIRISQDEYINAFGTDSWRKTVRNSVNCNQDYCFPPDDPEPAPQQTQPDPPAPATRQPDNPSQSTQPNPQPPPNPPNSAPSAVRFT